MRGELQKGGRTIYPDPDCLKMGLLVKTQDVLAPGGVGCPPRLSALTGMYSNPKP